MDQFSAQHVTTSEATIFIKRGGSGQPLLLLHGFPETHHMWRQVAPLLAKKFTVVMADLRGYGASSCPPSAKDHAPYSKRAMAQDMVEVMAQLGYTKFAVIGHDRGARVAYRMALDYPEKVTQLVALDIVPTDIAWEKADVRMMLGFWPWSLFAQPAPLPEYIIGATAQEIVDNACDNWGSSPSVFSAGTRDLYARTLKDPKHAHAICEEYRAAATIDREHDAADRQAGHAITCPTLVLWAEGGALDTWYTKAGGSLVLWKTIAPSVEGRAIPGGHFFPEENPEGLLRELNDFLG